MKSAFSLLLLVLALAVTLSTPPNVARQQKRALLPPEIVVDKATVAAAEQAIVDSKHQIQINYDADLILAKLNWIIQNEAAE